MKTSPYIVYFLLALVVFLLSTKSGNEKTIVNAMGEVEHPADNAFSDAKVELGRKLFFDSRLSSDSSLSCASCHLPELAFTDGRKTAIGVNGAMGNRNAPTLLNVGYQETFMFDAHLETLEKQVIVPIQEPIEMNMNMVDLIERLRKDPYYVRAAREIFDRDFDPWVLTRSISAFERTLVSDNSRFDQYMYHGNEEALTKSELRGWKLFSEKLYCTECHKVPLFTNLVAENNGLYSDYGEDKGRFRIHKDSNDIGKFKVPTLRNIVLTAPYMHDGSFSSLEEVIDHYSKGGEDHWNKSDLIKPFELSQSERKDLLNFFEALTDTSYMKRFR